MRSILFPIALLLACSCKAEMHYFNFEFKGFEIWGDDPTHYWQPNAAISGFFSGDDRNGDEQISRDELTALTVNGRDYFTCPSEEIWHGCEIMDFAYRPGEVVKLRTSEWFHSLEISVTRGFQTYDPAIPFYDEFSSYDGRYSQAHWIPTLGTSYSLVPTVPEPSMAVSALLGLALVGMFGAFPHSRNFNGGAFAARSSLAAHEKPGPQLIRSDGKCSFLATGAIARFRRTG